MTIPGLTSIIFPTTGRPQQAAACLWKLAETTPEALEVVVLVDANDTDTARELYVALDAMKTPTLTYRLMVFASRVGPVVAWNKGASLATGDVLVLAADDLEFTAGWLYAARRTMAGFEDGWGIVGLNDGHHDGTESFTPHYAAHRTACCRILGGALAIPGYRHVWFDYEVKSRAVAAGRYAWAKDALVIHHHPDFGERPRDTQDFVKAAHYEADRVRYLARQAAGWPNDYEAVIQCTP